MDNATKNLLIQKIQNAKEENPNRSKYINWMAGEFIVSCRGVILSEEYINFLFTDIVDQISREISIIMPWEVRFYKEAVPDGWRYIGFFPT